MVWMFPFCSSVAELNRWLGTQKLSGVDRSAQTRQVHINSSRIQMHTPQNPNCSRWYDHEWLKADYKPDSPPPFVPKGASAVAISPRVPAYYFIQMTICLPFLISAPFKFVYYKDWGPCSMHLYYHYQKKSFFFHVLKVLLLLVALATVLWMLQIWDIQSMEQLESTRGSIAFWDIHKLWKQIASVIRFQ